MKPLANLYLNDTLLNEDSETQVISSFDKISIECNICYIPHVYVIMFPKSKDEILNFSFAHLNDFNMSTNPFNYNLNIEEVNKINAYNNLSNMNRNTQANQNSIISNLSDMANIKSALINPLISNLSSRHPDIALGNKWTNHEKESLRKYLLIYGYGRWKIIKHNSRGVLSEKPELELRIFSNAFLKVIIEFLPQEKQELRKFLINLINESSEEPFIIPKKDDWGTLLKQRAPAWGKRIQLIFRVCLIIEKFKSERKNNKEKRKKIDILTKKWNLNHANEEKNSNSNIEVTEKEKKENNESIKMDIDNNNQSENGLNEIEIIKSQINKTFDYWDNLLNFLPNHAFYGQRPSVWWTRTHDIDLLRGTYKQGYANYQLMRSDPKLSFSKVEKDSNFQEFPNADTITRRIKKLIQIIIKSESSNGIISFEDKKSLKEPTGFNLEEKNNIINFLADYGVPLNNEGKSDWQTLKDQLVRIVNLDPLKTPQAIERLVQRIRMISQLVIQLNGNENSK